MTTEHLRSEDLLDSDLRDEIELVSDLVVAASSSPRHFTPAEVDALLGVGRGVGRGAGSGVGSSVARGDGSGGPAYDI